MPLFKSEFYMASSPDSKVPAIVQHSFSLSLGTIGNLGELYTGTLIKHLGQHFEEYVTPTSKSLRWNIKSSSSGIKVGKILMQSEKQKAPAVSGNIGESVVIPGISSTLKTPMRNLKFHRIKSKVKCPDYRIYLSNQEILKLWPTAKLPAIMPDLPLEVKTSFTKDNYYPPGALQQLYTYWEESNNPSIQGYGIVARVYLNKKETCIRYYLFIKNKKFTMKNFKKIAYSTTSKKGVRISVKDKTIKIGRMFD